MKNMFYSHCLLSKKGLLGTIWVAAHCHKRLKKDQVSRTNISSSVDKILLDEVPVVTYRILAYLLLGVVRIYSKKVEYLFRDCRDVLMKINDCTVRKKLNMRMEAMCAPYGSITLPERFELDAFDLEILEDVSGGNVRPSEEIMLKDTWEKEGIGYHSFDKYHNEGGYAQFETCSTAYTPVKDVRSPHLMDSDRVVYQLHTANNLEASMEKLRGEWFPFEECLQPVMLGEANEEPNPTTSAGEEHQSFRKQIKFLDTEMFCGAEKEPPDLVRSFDKEKHMEAELIKFQEITSPESKENRGPTEDCVDPISVNVSPETQIPEASGGITPEFMVVRTPATKERAKLSKKRKCCVDDIIVLPNQVLKQQIDNSSDLVCKRRKAPHTALHAWKASRISNLPQSFLEPLISGLSLDLWSLFFKKKLKTSERVKTTEALQNSDVLGSPTVHVIQEQTEVLPSTPVVEPPENIEVLQFPAVHRSPDQVDIAPSTPTTRAASLRFHEVPEISISDRMGPSSSFESVQKELSQSEDQELDISLLNEEVNSCEGDKQETDMWSVRTRAVARYLLRKFQNGKEPRGNKALSLLQVLEGKTRKESSRIFHEILALKTGGCIDVKQDKAYSDILVLETSKLKKFCEANGVYAS